MKILVTGAKGFVGRNLTEALKCIRDGKKRDTALSVDKVYEYDKEDSVEELERFCKECDFVFNLAGVNRPQNEAEFDTGNHGFAEILTDMLKSCHNDCPVMISSSIQAALIGRYADSPYGKSKLAGEEVFFRYGEETGAKVLVYRFPNLFGKWCRPNYNSAVATFCNAVANDLEYTVHDRDTELELLYIDDLVDEMLAAMAGKEHRCEYDGVKAVSSENGRYCYVPVTHRVTIGEIVDLLETYKKMPSTLYMPEIPEGSFGKKLYSTYLSYLPAEKMAYDIRSNIDYRGNFTELIRTKSNGQFSVNIARPGITRGQHWHNSKWEIFIVVSGHGLIQERRIGIDPKTDRPYPVISFEVTGKQLKAVQMLPGYTHSITNLSETEELVTVMWANEQFDPGHPDTFFESVDKRENE